MGHSYCLIIAFITTTTKIVVLLACRGTSRTISITIKGEEVARRRIEFWTTRPKCFALAVQEYPGQPGYEDFAGMGNDRDYRLVSFKNYNETTEGYAQKTTATIDPSSVSVWDSILDMSKKTQNIRKDDIALTLS
jgi:hypothetical protein